MSDPAAPAPQAAAASADANPLSRTTLWIVLAVTAASLAVAVVLTIFGDELGGGQPSVGTDTYSVSAIGHNGLVALLEELDIPVVRSRSASASKAAHGLLVIAEPSVSDEAGKQRLAALVAESRRTLLVLPKWYGQAAVGETWIHDAQLRLASEVQDVLGALALEASLQRAPAATRWSGEVAPAPIIREPQTVAAEQGTLEAEVTAADGSMLLFRVPLGDEAPDEAPGDQPHELWVLTDPDVLNNHGLAVADNARFTVGLLDRLRDGGPVVFDEIVHGYGQPPSLLRTLFSFPLILATLQVLICGLLAVWAAMVRFGPLRPAPPPLAPGKDFLIQNTAALLHYGGHHADALRRYLAHNVAVVRQALHAPELPASALTRWMDELAVRRGGALRLGQLEREVATATGPQQTLELADRVYRWRMEMMHGTAKRS